LFTTLARDAKPRQFSRRQGAISPVLSVFLNMAAWIGGIRSITPQLSKVHHLGQKRETTVRSAGRVAH
jgi:hypothetical protein